MIDEYVDELAGVAARLPGMVRSENPDTVAAWLGEQAAADRERWYRDLALLLAAAVPDDRSWLSLTAWVVGDGRPDTPEKIERRRLELCGGDRTVVDRAVAGVDPGRALGRDERIAVIRELTGVQPLRVVAQRAQCSVRTVQRILNAFGFDEQAA